MFFVYLESIPELNSEYLNNTRIYDVCIL